MNQAKKRRAGMCAAITPILLMTIATSSVAQVETTNAEPTPMPRLSRDAVEDSAILSSITQLERARQRADAAIEGLEFSDPTAAKATLELARELLAAGEIVEAREVYAIAVGRHQHAYGDNGKEVFPVLIEAADASSYLAATDYLRIAMKVAKKRYGKNSAEYVASAVRNLELEVEHDRLDGSLARDVYKRARKALPPDSRLRARATLLRSVYSFRRGTLVAAIRYADEARTNFELSGYLSPPQERTLQAILATSYLRLDRGCLATPHIQALSKLNAEEGLDNLKVLFSTVPAYPNKAYIRLQKGIVDLTFTIDKEGKTTDIRIIDDSGQHEMAAAAISALRGFRFTPRFEDGEFVETSGITERIVFDMGNSPKIQGRWLPEQSLGRTIGTEWNPMSGIPKCSELEFEYRDAGPVEPQKR